MRSWKNCRMRKLTLNFSCKHINFRNSVNFISKKLHTNCPIRTICWKDFHYIAMHTKRTTFKIHLISCILYINQLMHNFISVNFHTLTKRHHHILIIIRTSDSINTRNRCHNNNIVSLCHRSSSRKSQFIDFIVNCRILRNISIR